MDFLLIPMFFLTIIFLTAISSTIYCVGKGAFRLVAGGGIQFSIDAVTVEESLLIFFPLVCTVAMLVILCASMRKGKSAIVRSSIASALICLTMLFLLPGYFALGTLSVEKRAKSSGDSIFQQSPKKKFLTAGLFRKTETGVYYFVRSNETTGIDGVFFPNERTSLPDESPVIFEGGRHPLACDIYNRDPLISESLVPPRFFNIASKFYLNWLRSCYAICGNLPQFRLILALMAASLCALAFSASFSSWNMMNLTCGVLEYAAIFVANSIALTVASGIVKSSYIDNDIWMLPPMIAVCVLNAAFVLLFVSVKLLSVFFLKNVRKETP